MKEYILAAVIIIGLAVAIMYINRVVEAAYDLSGIVR